MSRRALVTVGASVAVVALLALALVVRDGDGPASAPPATTTTTSVVTSTSETATSTATTTRSSTTAPPTTGPPPPTDTTSAPVAPAVVIRQGPATERIVALTFDAGSDTGHASKILDTLASNRIRATFGLTGRWADANATLVRRIVAEGHQVVNHSYDHPSFTGYSTGEPPLSRAARLDQLARAEASIRAAGGATTLPWFRPPYGDEDPSVRSDVALAGYRYELMWTVDSLGWRGEPVSGVVARCLDRAEPGAIYLFHVGADSTDASALQTIIDGLRQRGYGFATAKELVG